MAAEEAKKVEVQPECPPEPPTDKPPVPEENDAKTVATDENSGEEKEKPAEDLVETEKKDALIKAWEESERSKIDNKAQKTLAAIEAWEKSKKAELEAEMKKTEENLEKKKAKYVEKMKNKVALLHKTAEEKRAITEAKRGEELLKTEEVAAKCRATGAPPKKLLIRWFSR